MTREEAIENLEVLKADYWDDDGYGNETNKYEDMSIALDMAIECLSAQNKAMTEEELAEFKKELANAVSEREKGEWIPVSERLPEENSHVLVSVKGEPDFVATDDYYSYGFDDWKDDVTAWMPAPEPYKGGEV